jgi:hypothetical protein
MKPSAGRFSLLSVTQPGLIDLCGFAALVHTRCALIVSGSSQISLGVRFFGTPATYQYRTNRVKHCFATDLKETKWPI